MQRVSPNDYMTGSAKQAVDTAMRDARAQIVGDNTPTNPDATRQALEAAQSAPGDSC